ncbi:MAG: hypothetical protein GXN92_03170 [Candidatus Micrarchaeota archaeon]|nr:hypothetical protein [Candidatus Micrarchaeota archaeon]
MLHAYKEAIKTYIRSLDVIALFSLVLVIALALPLLFPDYFFWTFSGVFLRISKLTDIGLGELLISLLLYGISLLLFSLAFLLISQVVKEHRSDHIRIEILKETIIRQYPELALFFLTFFMIIFAVAIFGYVGSWPDWLLTLALVGLGYVFFFVPFAIAIDEYTMEEALVQLWKYKHRLFHYPLLYALTIGALTILVALVFLLLTNDLETTRLLSNIVNALVIVPFGIILGSHFYFDKYTLSIREI